MSRTTRQTSDAMDAPAISPWRAFVRSAATKRAVAKVVVSSLTDAKVSDRKRKATDKPKKARRKIAKDAQSLARKAEREIRRQARAEVIDALAATYPQGLSERSVKSLSDTIDALTDLYLRGTPRVSDRISVAKFMAMYRSERAETDAFDSAPSVLTDSDELDALNDLASDDWVELEEAARACEHYTTLASLTVRVDAAEPARVLFLTFVGRNATDEDGDAGLAADWLIVKRETQDTERFRFDAPAPSSIQLAGAFGERVSEYVEQSRRPLTFVMPSSLTEREHATIMRAVATHLGAAPTWVGWFVPELCERASAKRSKQPLAGTLTERRSAHRGVNRIVVHYSTRVTDETRVGRAVPALTRWHAEYDAFAASVGIAKLNARTPKSDAGSKRKRATKPVPVRGATRLSEIGLTGSESVKDGGIIRPTQYATDALASLLKSPGKRSLRSDCPAVSAAREASFELSPVKRPVPMARRTDGVFGDEPLNVAARVAALWAAA